MDDDRSSKSASHSSREKWTKHDEDKDANSLRADGVDDRSHHKHHSSRKTKTKDHPRRKRKKSRHSRTHNHPSRDSSESDDESSKQRRDSRRRHKQAAKYKRNRNEEDDDVKRSGSARSNSDSSSELSYEQQRRRARKRKKKRKRDYDDSSSDDSLPRDRKKKKKKSRKRKHRSRDEDQPEDAETMPPGGVSFGKYGVIKASDFYKKQRSFEVWMAEVKGIQSFNGPKWELQNYFSEYCEDFNTATLPHIKYYDFDDWEMKEYRKQEARQKEKQGQSGALADEARHRMEMREKAKDKQKAETELLRATMNTEKIVEMKRQAQLQSEMAHAFKTGDQETFKRLQRKLEPESR